ncbi:head decoration protein [Streptomyces luteireticuli]|uniref:head decoration protein n=1 Tax=Streptomyces luteireticuli TaxID=173858 RepID=UPI003556ECC4
MDLQPLRTTESVTADRPWLASQHGLDSPLSITLDATTFTQGTHWVPGTPLQPRHRFLSGVPLGRITATGLYGPWAAAATDGRAVFAGVLLTETYFAPGSKSVGGALLWHGAVTAALVPGGLDPTAITKASAQITFV